MKQTAALLDPLIDIYQEPLPLDWAKYFEKDAPLYMSTINWAEIVFKICKHRGEEFWHQLRLELMAYPIHLVDVTAQLAEKAAVLKNKYALGLADAMAAALAYSEKATLVTKDNDFKCLEQNLKIFWI